MSYIAKAFIATPTVAVKVPLMYQLKDLGYRENVIGVIGQDTHLCVNKGPLQGLMPNDTEDYIDCNAYTPNGTEEEAVKLFLELAQMDEDDGSTQWVECEGKIVKTYFSLIDKIEKCKTLSPQQFAEAYKAKNIVL